MYRITIYEDDLKNISEFNEEDEMRDFTDTCLDDLEQGFISSFTVSRISQARYQKPFWDKKRG